MFAKFNLDSIYSNNSDKIRVGKYIEEFQKKFKTKNYTILRTPGRVNLIGEHIDYSNLPVFPAGIEKDIYIIFKPSDNNLITITSFGEKFPKETFQLTRNLQSFTQGHWGNYVKAGIQTILDYFDSTGKGFQALIAGNIPAGSGLSSSSALVVASAGAYLTANNLDIDKLVLAEKLAEGEKYVGTAGGGMDQTASVFAKKNHAIKIDFAPLNITPVPFPDQYDIVISHSLTVAEKSKGAKDAFNLRSMETKIATALLSQYFQSNHGDNYSIRFIGDLRDDKFAAIKKNIKNIIEELFIDKQQLNIEDIGEILNLDTQEKINQFFTLKNGSLFPYKEYPFKLEKRIKHIITEWERVENSVKTLKEGNIKKFGQLMNESHESCKNNYEISCTELDTLVDIERKNGAIGARLTGAGFGGSTVCLVPKETTETFIHNVINEYYKDYLKNRTTEIKDFSEFIFKTKATQGTCLIEN